MCFTGSASRDEKKMECLGRSSAPYLNLGTESFEVCIFHFQKGPLKDPRFEGGLIVGVQGTLEGRMGGVDQCMRHLWWILYTNINWLVVLCPSCLHFTKSLGFGLTYMALDDTISTNPLLKMLILCVIWVLTFNCRVASRVWWFVNKVLSYKKGSSSKNRRAF